MSNPSDDPTSATTLSDIPRSEPVQSTSRTGDMVVGKYLLLRPVAQGAMGTVWTARNLTLDLTVAIKIVHPHVKYPFVAPALLWEAQAACKLAHPAVVRVYDFGQLESGDTFIVMEYLVGETLRALLCREERVSPERAVKLMLPIADGLAAAHAQGIVHRDLKPENVVLVTDHAGRIQPKLIDFGVAKLSWVADDWVSDATVVGTPGYMPLEQVSGLRIDARVDVWAYSATLYELIAGSLPFRSSGMAGAVSALRNDSVPSLVDVGVDPELWEIVERGLRRHPEDRWASIDAMREALAAWLSSRPPVSLSPRSSRPPSARGEWDADASATSSSGGPRSSPPSGGEATSIVIPLAKRIHRDPVPTAPDRPALPEPFIEAHEGRRRSRAPRAFRHVLRWTLAASVATATFFAAHGDRHLTELWRTTWTSRAATLSNASDR